MICFLFYSMERARENKKPFERLFLERCARGLSLPSWADAAL